jgi:uncharacterized membrane protein YoaK (UPF0700 family)
MKNFGSPRALAALLAFNGGFVDTAGFLGLQGLFTAHVTGNFVTLAATLIEGSHGVVGKMLALPEFILVVALARLAANALRRRGRPVLSTLLSVKVLLLAAFFVMAVVFGPFPNADSPAALLTGFSGIAAMALQNAVHRVHLPDQPPSTLMTGSTTQATIDAVDLMVGGATPTDSAARMRLRRLVASILYFAVGCAVSALLYWKIGFWCLAVPVVIGAVAAMMQLKPQT